MGYNWLDFVLIMLLLIGMATGYAQGMLRQVIGLAALYVGAVVATQYFQVVSRTATGVLRTTPDQLTNAVAFFVILLVVVAVINFLAFDAYRVTRLHIFPLLDHMGGMVIGLVSMWIIISLVVNVLMFATGASSWADIENARLVLRNGLVTSVMVPVSGSTLPLIISSIRPWLPGGMPAIFDL